MAAMDVDLLAGMLDVDEFTIDQLENSKLVCKIITEEINSRNTAGWEAMTVALSRACRAKYGNKPVKFFKKVHKHHVGVEPARYRTDIRDLPGHPDKTLLAHKLPILRKLMSNLVGQKRLTRRATEYIRILDHEMLPEARDIWAGLGPAPNYEEDQAF